MVAEAMAQPSAEEASAQVLATAGAEAERRLSKARLVILGLVLMIAGALYLGGIRSSASPVLAILAGVATVEALFAYVWLRRRRYRLWLGMMTAVLDAGLTGAAVGLTIQSDSWLLGLAVMAVVAAGLRCDHRIVLAAGVAAVTGLLLAPALADGSAQLSGLEDILILLTATAFGFWLVNSSGRLLWLSTHDPASGALTRNAFMHEADREYLRAEREEKRLTLVLAEVDEFDRLQSDRPQADLDRILGFVASRLQSGTRRYDLVARWNENGFVMLFPNASKRIVVTRMESLRDTILKESAGKASGAPGFQVTLSAGVATYPQDAGKLELILHQAQRLLEQARAQGEDTLLYGELGLDEPGAAATEMLKG